MKIFHLSVWILTLIFFVGCQQQSTVVMPEPRPLANDYKTFVAPAKPVLEPQSQLVFEEPNEDLTLKDVITLTLLNNPELQSYSWEIRAAQARQLQAGLWSNPTLDVGVENVVTGFNMAETTIQLIQLIELGDKPGKRKKLASIEQQLAGWDYETKRLEVLTNASKAYFELLALQQKTKLLSQLVDVSQKSYTSVKRRVEAGKDSPIEETKALVALSTVELDYQQALYQSDNARKNVASFWGNFQPRFKQAIGDLDMISDLPEINVLKQKISQSPQLARWENQIARGKAALQLENAKAIPDLSVAAGGTKFNETSDNAFVFGMSIPLQIFDRNQGGKLEAAYNLSKSYELQNAAHIEVMNQFNQIFTELQISYNKISQLKSAILPGAEQVFNASQMAYTEGKIDYLNVLDSQRTYFLSQTEYIETLVSYHKAKTDLEGLIGQSIDSIQTVNN